MVQVRLGSSTGSKTVIVDGTKTLRQILEDNGVDYSMATVNVDGATLQVGELDRSLDDLGITERCYLGAIVKADNAIDR